MIFCGIRLQILHHRRNFGIGNTLTAPARRDVVIGDAKSQLGLGYGTTARFHLAEGVKRPFMDVVSIDPEQSRAIFASRNLMSVP
jgi:hypothetical protein